MGGEKQWCVVTGGRGFAARHLVVMLIKYGMFSVRIADLGPTIKLDEDEENGVLGEALKSGHAEYVSADLRDKTQVLRALIGVKVVFHMAAPDSSINNHRLHYSVNVQVHGISNGDESLAYPATHNDSYSATKAEGESLVINSSGSNGLLTCCIRPSSIFGPGDKLLVPSLVSAARSGKLKFIIGNGNNMYDFTYVENVAHAHICAERALASEGAVADRAAGQVYFITNAEPIKFWEFVSLILEGLGYERPKIKIPAFLVMPVAHMVELTYKVFAPYGMKVPQFIPSRIRLLSLSRTFNCSKANELLGYTPIVPLQDGIRRTIDSYQYLRADARVERGGPSKAELLLGSGKVAETLLWRDIKQTLTVLVFLAALYFNFVATGLTLITSVSKLLLVAAVFLFVHGRLPQKILGYQIEKIPESKFHVSEAASHQVALSVVSIWNSAASDLKSLGKGNDTTLFLKVALSLLLLSILGVVSPHYVFAIGLPFIFISFAVYEKKEQEIDNLVLKALSFGCKLKSGSIAKISNLKKRQ